MKNRLVTLILLSVLAVRAGAKDEAALFRAEEGGKWGFINKSGEFVIKPQYDDSFYPFNEGLAAVQVGAKWGYIDRSNRMVISPKYTGAQNFENGIAAVREGGSVVSKERWIYIDKTGRYLFETDEKLSYLGFDEGMMQVKKGDKWGYLDTNGAWAIPPQFVDTNNFSEGLAGVVHEDGTAGFINPKGEWVIRLTNARPHYMGFSEGLAAVFDEKEGKYGFVNKDGNFVIPPQFCEVREFSEGRAAVCVQNHDETGWPLLRWGVIDRNGKFIVPAEYKTIWSFEEGMAKAVTEEGDGFLDRSGKLAIPCKFTTVDPFQNGLAYVRVGGYDEETSWCGYINRKGEFVWRPKDFSEKDKARAFALVEEQKREPSIRILKDSKGEGKGLLVTCRAKVPFQGEGAFEVPISVINLLDEEVFLEVTGMDSLSYSLDYWDGGSSAGGGIFTIFPDNKNLLKRLHATNYQKGERFTCGCCITRIKGKLDSEMLHPSRARGAVNVWIRGFYRNTGKHFSEFVELPIELVEKVDDSEGENNASPAEKQ